MFFVCLQSTFSFYLFFLLLLLFFGFFIENSVACLTFNSLFIGILFRFISSQWLKVFHLFFWLVCRRHHRHRRHHHHRHHLCAIIFSYFFRLIVWCIVLSECIYFIIVVVVYLARSFEFWPETYLCRHASCKRWKLWWNSLATVVLFVCLLIFCIHFNMSNQCVRTMYENKLRHKTF